MTIKIADVANLPAILGKIKSQKLPFKTSYHIVLLVKEVEKHVEFYQESFRNIRVEYGKKDEDGNFIPTEDGQGILLVEETINEAYAKLAELRDLDVTLPDVKFSVEDFSNIELSPEETYLLMPFIED